MLVFIDESGDAGFKIARGSSANFVIVLIIFDDGLDAETAALEIKKLRRELRKSNNFEFKFNGCNREIRLAFLQRVRRLKFRIRAIVFSKKDMYSMRLRSSTDNFYSFALKEVLEHNNNTIKRAKVRLDGSGERKFKRNLVAYLRKSLNSNTQKVMENLRFRDSKEDVLIQLADMVAGALKRYYDHQSKDWNDYWSIIKVRKEDIWEFK